MTPADIQELSDIAAGKPPAGMLSEKRRVRFKREGLAIRDELKPWGWRLTQAGRTALTTNQAEK